MEYYELKCTHLSNPELVDYLIAELGEIGFESFAEQDDKSMLAYIKREDFSEENIRNLKEEIADILSFEFEIQLIPDQNWNAKWEENYEAVTIDNLVEIRAPFHQANPKATYHIVIEPKMSFGTAHHPTTSQMISLIKDENIKGKSVLDMGCGTAVLAIFAKILGAGETVAIDNDEWAYHNSVENVVRNNFADILVELGDANLLKNRKFDLIFANINRNILLNDMQEYSECLNPNGIILFSGFYTEDLKTIKASAESYSMKFDRHISLNNWVAARFIKS